MTTIPLLCISGAVVVVSTAAILIFSSRRKWREETEAEFKALLRSSSNVEVESSDDNKKKKQEKEKTEDITISGVPPLIERHLLRALHVTSPNVPIKRIKTLSIRQEGQFFLNGQWIPFTAVQAFSASNANPGFVWEANMRLPLPSIFGKLGGSLGINVRDAYVDGRGTMVGKLLGFLTIVDMRDTPELNEGEISRWLGECLVFPTALIPNNNTGDERVSLTWKDCGKESTKAAAATAVLVDSRSAGEEKVKTEIEFRCDENDGLIRSIYALRPYSTGSKEEVKILPWEGHFYDYEDRQGVLVPTRMEVGWWKDGTLEKYFKGENITFDFTFY